jgi:predicted nucleotide-binding protein
MSAKTSDHEQVEPEADEEAPKPENSKTSHGSVKKGGRVCITYGKDQIMNRQVVSLIRELGIDPIVMQDKNNLKKPLAQFLTENLDISFVIAILSADDWVYPKKGKPKDALLYATQQVVFHLGYWVGKLGRNHVFALYYDQRSFRWPTEHFDIIYTPLDDRDAWKKELVRRIKESGIEIRGKIN